MVDVMASLNFGSQSIDYTIKKGKRKRTVAIQVISPSQVVVLTPHSLSREKVEEIVRKRSQWILQKQERLRNLARLYPAREFVSGDRLLYLGRRYALKVSRAENGAQGRPAIEGRRIVVSVGGEGRACPDKNIVREALLKWYLSEADQVIRRRVELYSKLLDAIPMEILVKEQRRRWGSCSSQGILRFNWQLIMAPLSITDYVVVHELCHLRVKNHSPDFWRLVSRALPDYRQRRKWLRDSSPLLKF